MTKYLHRLILEVVLRGDPTEIRDDEAIRYLIEAYHLGYCQLTSRLSDELVPLIAQLRVVLQLIVRHP